MNKLLPIFILVVACSGSKQEQRLPFYGNTIYEKNDTIYHTVDKFELMDQDSAIVSNESLSDQIYVADFFFTSCPTICPTMKTQLLRVYEKFEENEEVVIVSHTIDPKYDTIPLLNDYAKRLGASANSWKFLWGEQEEIYDLAESYLSIADEEENAPGGFVHSGAFLLIDKEGRIRGFYEGTKPEQVDVLMSDIEKLLQEYNPKEKS